MKLASDTSYMRFLLYCALGFSIGGVILLMLGAFVFEPNHEIIEAHNIEAGVSFAGGCLSLCVAVVFAILVILQRRKVKQMHTLTNNLLLDGKENTLYQVIHQNTSVPKKPLVMAAEHQGAYQEPNVQYH